MRPSTNTQAQGEALSRLMALQAGFRDPIVDWQEGHRPGLQLPPLPWRAITALGGLALLVAGSVALMLI